MNPNPSPPKRASRYLTRVISPWQFLALGAFSFLSLAGELLLFACHYPRDSFWHSLMDLAASISFLLAPAVCIGSFFELLRRGWDWRLLMSGFLAAAGVAIFVGAIYWRIRALGV